MEYTISIENIKDEQGEIIETYPALYIKDDEQYGFYFTDEISHILSAEYLEEIVDRLSALMQGWIETYSFGHEVYRLQCSRTQAVVIDLSKSNREVAVIPIGEVHELMTDWKKYVLEWLKST